MKKLLIAFIIIFYSAAYSHPAKKQIDSADIKIRHLMEYQDQKDILEIGKLLSDPDSKVIRQAAVALANLQDTIAVHLLSEIAKKSDNETKAVIFFALGQIRPCWESGSYLFSELPDSKDEKLRAALFEALGKCGSPNMLDSLLKISAQSNFDETSKLMGITRFALRGIKNSGSVEYIINRLKSNDNSVREKAAYALWRSSSPALLREHMPVIYEELNKTESAGDYYLINCLLPLPPNDTLKQLLLKNLKKGVNVQLSTLKVLEKYKLAKDETDMVLEIGKSTNEHVKLAVYRFISRMAFKDSSDIAYVTDIIKKLLTKEITWRERAELFNTLGVYEGEKILDVLVKESRSKNERFNAKLIKTIGNINSPSAVKALLFKVEAVDPFSIMAQLEAIESIKTRIKQDSVENYRQIKNILLKSLRSKNIAIVTTAVMAANNNQFRNLIPFNDYVNTFKKLRVPDDVEGILEFIKLFTFIGTSEAIAMLESEVNSESSVVSEAAINNLYDLTGKEYERSAAVESKTKSTSKDWKYFERLVANPVIEIKTEKGKIKIELFPLSAPFTSMSICKLIDKKYFDGLVFHRVVSNFVIQGGDPMGTGWGGPGYSIRTEISPLKFEAGSVGMASAGKDTEGSQFFITHSPQPNLDGKYTVFGKVMEGMDVVDKIQEGDKMISVRRLK